MKRIKTEFRDRFFLSGKKSNSGHDHFTFVVKFAKPAILLGHICKKSYIYLHSTGDDYKKTTIWCQSIPLLLIRKSYILSTFVPQ